VRDPGQDQRVEVSQHRLERLRVLGRLGREPRTDVTGPHASEHGSVADRLQVAGHPLERRLPVVAEGHIFFRIACTSDHGRVFRTWSRVSQPRRACATPSSTKSSAATLCPSLEIAIFTPASAAARA
jgi:hypothetical protein